MSVAQVEAEPQLVREARELASPHVERAIARLVELMECEGRQAHVAVAACRTIIETANPQDEDRLRVQVERKLQEVLEQARAARAKRIEGSAP